MEFTLSGASYPKVETLPYSIDFVFLYFQLRSFGGKTFFWDSVVSSSGVDGYFYMYVHSLFLVTYQREESSFGWKPGMI